MVEFLSNSLFLKILGGACAPLHKAASPLHILICLNPELLIDIDSFYFLHGHYIHARIEICIGWRLEHGVRRPDLGHRPRR
jgi:hypothetical protein